MEELSFQNEKYVYLPYYKVTSEMKRIRREKLWNSCEKRKSEETG